MPERVSRLAKKAFDIHTVVRRIRKEVEQYADAAMFDLRSHGYSSVFQQLVACIISIRTLDEVSLPVSIDLLKRAPTAEKMAALSEKQIDSIISRSTFHEQKARNIREIARRAVKEFGGDVPADFDVLTSFRGVGPKCANLALGIAANQERISVDVHVARVTARWGYVEPGSPDRVREQLEEMLPKKYWIEINRLLVPFGKHVCTGRLPRCSTCPVLVYCRQVGVVAHR
ncbi:MAG TPA: endonuclease III [Gemmatimonadaceae bacterium]